MVSRERPLVMVAAMAREARIARAVARDRDWLTVALCGIGPERAARCAREQLAGGAGGLLSVGVAGALDPALVAGDLLLPASVCAEGDAALPVSERLHRTLRAALPGGTAPNVGLLVSVASPVSAERHRLALAAGTGAVAVDMESAALAAVANEAGVPFAVLRTVSDPVGQELPACTRGALDAYGRVRMPALLAGLARRPAEALVLARLASGVRRAERALRTALDTALPPLAGATS